MKSPRNSQPAKEMTKIEVLKFIETSHKNKYERAYFIDSVNGPHSMKVFCMDVLSAQELKDQFNTMLQEQEEKCINTFLEYYCNNHIIIKN